MIGNTGGGRGLVTPGAKALEKIFIGPGTLKANLGHPSIVAEVRPNGACDRLVALQPAE
jgi:hypothetical protein